MIQAVTPVSDRAYSRPMRRDEAVRFTIPAVVQFTCSVRMVKGKPQLTAVYPDGTEIEVISVPPAQETLTTSTT